MSEAGTSKHIKRKDLSLADKILVIDELEKKTSQSTVAKKFGISQSQVLQILKSKEKLFSAHRSNKNPTRKRERKSTQEDVEDALLQWFKQAKSRGLIITGPMLREKETKQKQMQKQRKNKCKIACKITSNNQQLRSISL